MCYLLWAYQAQNLRRDATDRTSHHRRLRRRPPRRPRRRLRRPHRRPRRPHRRRPPRRPRRPIDPLSSPCDPLWFVVHTHRTPNRDLHALLRADRWHVEFPYHPQAMAARLRCIAHHHLAPHLIGLDGASDLRMDGVHHQSQGQCLLDGLALVDMQQTCTAESGTTLLRGYLHRLAHDPVNTTLHPARAR